MRFFYRILFGGLCIILLFSHGTYVLRRTSHRIFVSTKTFLVDQDDNIWRVYERYFYIKYVKVQDSIFWTPIRQDNFNALCATQDHIPGKERKRS